MIQCNFALVSCNCVHCYRLCILNVCAKRVCIACIYALNWLSDSNQSHAQRTHKFWVNCRFNRLYLMHLTGSNSEQIVQIQFVHSSIPTHAVSCHPSIDVTECRCTWELKLGKMSIWNPFYIFVIHRLHHSLSHTHHQQWWTCPCPVCPLVCCSIAQNLLLNRQFQFNHFN